jgi:hypothetical protein
MLTRIPPLLLQISHQTKQRGVCSQKQTSCSTYIPTTCAKHQSFVSKPENMLRWVLCNCVSHYDRFLQLALNPQKIKSIIKYSAAKLNKLKSKPRLPSWISHRKKIKPKRKPLVFYLIFPIDGDPVLFSSSVSWTCESGY